jgi:glycosyltransferase involved in cell wall biosynthesis
MNSLRLVAVICTHNRSNLLMKTIDSINAAARPDNCTIELLVIPNNCSDNTVELLESYQANDQHGDRLSLRFSVEEKTGKSYALNHAIDIINDGILCFVDDDHRVDEHYFTSICTTLRKHNDATMLCGRIIPDWTGHEPSWVHDTGKYRIYPLPIPDFQLGNESVEVCSESKLPGGGNLIIYRDVFERTGNFSTSLGPKGRSLLGSEDSDFVMRALDNGESLRYNPAIMQYHYVDMDRLKLSYLIRKSFQRSRSITLARHPERSGIPRYLWRKLVGYLPGVLFSLGGSKTRFYLMRLAATLGEIVGLKEEAS